METTLPQAREKVAALIERHAARKLQVDASGDEIAGARGDPMS